MTIKIKIKDLRIHFTGPGQPLYYIPEELLTSEERNVIAKANLDDVLFGNDHAKEKTWLKKVEENEKKMKLLAKGMTAVTIIGKRKKNDNKDY